MSNNQREILLNPNSLFHKLVKLGVGGFFLRALQSIYHQVSYCIKLSSGLSEIFPSNVGVKQGCVLSPTLFNLFTQDLPDIFDEGCMPPILFDIPVSCLMYADDLVIISQTAAGLQNALNLLNVYCQKWHLTVNIQKTKIMVFNKGGKTLKKHRFQYNQDLLEVTASYQYLGIVFSSCGSFTKAVEHLTNQAFKAMFKLKQKLNMQNVPTALKLFDVLILPIIRYCSEVWSPFFTKAINERNFLHLCDKLPAEKLHTNFCRFLLYVNRKASNIAVRAELGRRPLLTSLTVHSFKYWLAVCNTKNRDSFVYKSYLASYNASREGAPGWAMFIHKNCDIFGMSEAWHSQGTRSKNKTTREFQQSVLELHDRNWWQDLCREDSKLRTYKEFKGTIQMENYLLAIKNPLNRREFTRLRISAHQLQIERGRYTVPRKTPIERRLCTTCNVLEDEKHFVLTCPRHDKERQELFNYLGSFTTFQSLTADDKFKYIMSYNLGDTEVLTHVVDFVNRAIETRTSIMSVRN